MGEHQTMSVSKTSEEHNTKLANIQEQISCISMILNDLSKQFAQF